MRLLILAVGVFFLVSCKTTSSDEVKDVLNPENGFRFTETGEVVGNRTLGPKDTKVDYKSTIHIEPVIGQLAKDVLPELTPKQKQEMQAVADLARSLKHVMAKWSKLGQELEEVASGRRRLTRTETAELQQRLLAESEARDKVLQFIKTYAKQVAKVRTGQANEDSPEFEAEFEAITTPLITDENDPKAPLNVSKLQAILKGEMERYIQDAEALQKSAVQVRIRAMLATGDKQRIPIHISNYDTIDNPHLVQEERISYGKADRERVEEEYKVNKEIADFANEALKQKGKLRSSLNGIVDAVKRDVDQIETSTRALFSGEAKTNLKTAIGQLKATGTSTQQEHITALEKLLDVSDGVMQSVSGLKALANSGNADAPKFMAGLLDAIDAFQNGLRDLKLKESGQAIEDLVQIASQQILATANQPGNTVLSNLVQTVLPSVQKELQNFEEANSRIIGLFRALGAVDVGATLASAGADIVDPRVQPQKLGSAPPGSIDLVNLANKGDKVEVRAELINDAGKIAREYPMRVFEAEKFDWTDSLSANVIFVNRFDSAGGADFVAAPSVSWTMHHRMPLHQDSGSIKKFYNYLDPGFGVNVATLNFDDSGVQIGIGGHISFFKDIFQVGAGYNLNASDNNGYVFVGISLLEVFKEGKNLLGK